MDIVAALFIENIELNRPFAGRPTQIDLTGVHFSAAAARAAAVHRRPRTSWCSCAAGPTRPAPGVLEVVFRRDGEQVARNVQPLQVEPGKFTYRLVRAEVDFDDYGTVEAHCRIDQGPRRSCRTRCVPGPADG